MPLHPFLVHFPIAAWLLGSLWLVVAAFAKRTEWAKAGWVLLTTAGIIALPAVLSGQQEYSALAHHGLDALERHRDLGNLLPWLMLTTLALKLHLSLIGKDRGQFPWPWCIVALAITALLLYTAWLGGQLVYSQGVPQLRVPS